ncbi:MAG TPA: glycosyl hydrolase [Thermomicrobiaceae bacterium]|nr:glycosyl hydrolase [Thermomicrobiaceae bacterium]
MLETGGDRVSPPRVLRSRWVTAIALCIVIGATFALSTVPLGARAAQAAPANRADLLGVSGNAFPWEANFGTMTQLLDQSHAGWARVELRWEQIEPSRGKWDWGSSDALVQGYHQIGMQELGLLVYSVGWASGGSGSSAVFGPPSDLAAWQEYVRQTVTRYKGTIHSWEIWNEPDTAWAWGGQDGGDAASYLALLQRAHDAIKAADPSATIVTGGVTGTARGADFINRLLDLGGGQYFDMVGIHGYIDPNAEDVYYNTIWPLLRQAAQRAGKPIWITEFGWSSSGTGPAATGSETAQASWIARELPMLFSLGNVAHVSLFQFKDPGNQPNTFGLVRLDGSKKPAYTVYQTYAAQLAGLRFQALINLGDGTIRDSRFNGPDRTLDVLWDESGPRVAAFSAGASVQVIHLDGSQQTLNPSNGSVSIPVGNDPVLVVRTGVAAFEATGSGQCQSFAVTGQSLCGLFLDFWQRYGGLAIFGYPLSGELQENGRTVQYLERAKLEYHPESANADWQVVGELVGRSVSAGREHEAPFQPLSSMASDAHCSAYVQTGHTLCNGFRAYWDQHGGLWMFGYPISQEFQEKNADTGQIYTVQYFERARFEYHPDNPDAYKVELGRLGAQLYGQRY